MTLRASKIERLPKVIVAKVHAPHLFTNMETLLFSLNLDFQQWKAVLKCDEERLLELGSFLKMIGSIHP